MKFPFLKLAAALLSVAFFVGCPSENKQEAKPYTDAPVNTDTHGQGHEHELGPHGGHVIEITEDESAHLEVTFDAKDRSVTIYVLGGDIKTPLPVKVDEIEFELEGADESEVELELTAKPLEGEAEGTASVFVVAGEKVPAAIDDIEKLHGHVHITIDGKELLGKLEHDHGDGGHDHADGEHDHDKDKDADHDHTENHKESKSPLEAEKPGEGDK